MISSVPARLRLHPGLKRRPVARVAHRRRRHHANLVHPVRLHRPLKPLQRPQRQRHRLRRHQPRLEDARPQPRHLAILGQRLQLVRHNLGNLQPARVRSNIDGGKRRHSDVRGAPRKNEISLSGQDTRPRHAAANPVSLVRLSFLLGITVGAGRVPIHVEQRHNSLQPMQMQPVRTVHQPNLPALPHNGLPRHSRPAIIREGPGRRIPLIPALIKMTLCQ